MYDKVLLAIPSKNRAAVFATHTYQWLQHVPYEYAIFVEPQDESAYQKISNKIVVLSESNKGLGFAKKEIYAYAKQYGFAYIFKIDDDVLGWTGRGKKQKEKTVQNFQQVVEDCIQAFEKHAEVQAISFPYRHELFDVKKWTGVNQRLQTCYITQLAGWHADENISVFEDFANFLFIRRNNGIVLRYGLVGIDCMDVGGGTGGHQDFNRAEKAQKEIALLKELYPALQVKRVERAWKIEPVFGGAFFAGKKL